MDEIEFEHRTVVKIFVWEGLTATEIHENMVNVLKECSPSLATVHRWVSEFNRGRRSVEDDLPEGRSKCEKILQTVARMNGIASESQRNTINELAESMGLCRLEIQNPAYHFIVAHKEKVRKEERLKRIKKTERRGTI